DALLDAEAVGRFLAVELRAGRPVPVARCEVVQTNYRFGKHLRLLYRLRIGRRWRWVSASAFPDGAAEEGFRGATQAAARRAGRRHASLARQLRPDDPHLRLPAPLACVAGGQMLLLEAIEGRRIGALQGREAEVGLERLGASLATFHSLEPPVEAPRFTRCDAACLTEAASVLARARPSLGAEAEALAGELVRRFEPPPDRPVCLHGDMHTGNGILAGSGVGLIDLDKVALGPAAIDLGRLLCLLRYKRLGGLLTAADERARVASLLAGYAGRRPLP